MSIKLRNKDTGLTKDIDKGISLISLAGIWVPLLRKEWKLTGMFIVVFLVADVIIRKLLPGLFLSPQGAILAFMLSNIPQVFLYNKLRLKHMLNNGWEPASKKYANMIK